LISSLIQGGLQSRRPHVHGQQASLPWNRHTVILLADAVAAWRTVALAIAATKEAADNITCGSLVLFDFLRQIAKLFGVDAQYHLYGN
jgi:hypothetical protein